MDEFILGIFEKRSVLKGSTLYQLLTGRRTSSVLVYGCLNDLLPFWGLFPRLSEEAYQGILKQLEATGSLEQDSTGFYHKIADESSLSLEKAAVLDALDNFRFNKSGEQGWRLIRFAIQVVSEYRRSKNFVPLETAPKYTEPVRQLIRSQGVAARATFYDELSCFFSELPERIADELAQSLTGYQMDGKADYQLLPQSLLEKPWQELAIKARQQLFIKTVAAHPETISCKLYQQVAFSDANQSALISRRLFQAGASMEDVMAQRHLKAGTINDHLIEWALSDSEFPYSRFFDNHTLDILQQLSGEPVAWRYGDIAQKEAIDYRTFALYQIAAKQEVSLCS